MTPFTTGTTVTRRRKVQSGVDRGGNPTYTTTETTLAEQAAFDPGGSREPVEPGRASVVTEPKLYFLNPVDLIAQDEVVVNGLTFTVEGDPAAWVHPWGSDVGGMVVELRKVAG